MSIVASHQFILIGHDGERVRIVRSTAVDFGEYYNRPFAPLSRSEQRRSIFVSRLQAQDDDGNEYPDAKVLMVLGDDGTVEDFQ